jgi:hypothetical protein
VACDGTFLFVVGYQGGGVGQTVGRIEKRSVADGAFDGGFGTGGAITTWSTGNSAVTGIALDATFLYVCGYETPPGNLAQWRIEKRNKSDGALVGGFGAGGAVTVDPTSSPDVATAIAIDALYLYVVGIDYGGAGNSAQWRIEKRNLSDGNPVAAFDGDGVAVSDPSANEDKPSSVALDGTYLYIAGHQNLGGGFVQSRLEKRNLSDGALVGAFDGDGVIVSDPAGIAVQYFHVAVDGAFVFVGGRDAGGSSTQWRLEKRDASDGSLVPAFGGTGVVTSDPGASADTLATFVVDGSLLYLGGSMAEVFGDTAWRIERRDATDGSLDPTFGVGGALTDNATSGLDNLYGLAVQPLHVFAAGSETSNGIDTFWRIKKRLKDAP